MTYNNPHSLLKTRRFLDAVDATMAELRRFADDGRSQGRKDKPRHVIPQN